MKAKLLMAVVAITTLAGCASGGDYKQYLEAQQAMAAKARPLLVIEAQPGQTITGLSRLEVNAPAQSGVSALAPPRSEVAGVVRDIGVAAIGAYTGVAMTRAVVGGVQSLGDNIERSGTAGYPYVQAPGAVTTNTASGGSVAGGGSITNTTSTSTDNHTTTPAPVVVTPVVTP